MPILLIRPKMNTSVSHPCDRKKSQRWGTEFLMQCSDPGLNRLRKKAKIMKEIVKNVLPGLKPALILLPLCGG
jgi:hypothetical protein